jgi:hypothetical protein
MRLTLAALALLAACSSARPMMLPSGRQGYYVRCRGQEEKCYIRAARLCPAGYDIAQAREYSNATATSYFGTVHVNQGFGHGTMLIECKTPAAQWKDPFVP